MIEVSLLQKWRNILILLKTIAFSGKIALDDVNVVDSLGIRAKTEGEYITSLPDGFHNPISSPIRTMSILKKKVKRNKASPAIDLENIFFHLLMIGQKQQLGSLFAYKLCSVPSSLNDEHGCLRKGNKSLLVKCLRKLLCLTNTKMSA